MKLSPHDTPLIFNDGKSEVKFLHDEHNERILELAKDVLDEHRHDLQELRDRVEDEIIDFKSYGEYRSLATKGTQETLEIILQHLR